MITYNRSVSLYGKEVFQRIKLSGHIEAYMSEELKACMTYVVNGREEIMTMTGTVACSNGSAIFKQCRNYIANVYPDKTNRVELLVIHFYPEVLKSIFSEDLLELKPLFSIERKIKNALKVNLDRHLEHYFEGLFMLFESELIENEELIKMKLKEVLFLLFHSKDGEYIKSLILDAFTPSVVRFKEVISQHLYSNITMHELAFLCSLSDSKFFRDFKKVFGISPKKYFQSKKLSKAAELLKYSDLSVSQICYQVGYNSVSRFSNNFKSDYALSPMAYRKEYSTVNL